MVFKEKSQLLQRPWGKSQIGTIDELKGRYIAAVNV
jgi:hypothetical protein